MLHNCFYMSVASLDLSVLLFMYCMIVCVAKVILSLVFFFEVVSFRTKTERRLRFAYRYNALGAVASPKNVNE
jgi:hypothetical protein